uniref:Uncharacterized protein n=1 Tax=Dromaius novaehollandiae TaxID=8790 RepID=A0A8C4J9C7_DRONO
MSTHHTNKRCAAGSGCPVPGRQCLPAGAPRLCRGLLPAATTRRPWVREGAGGRQPGSSNTRLPAASLGPCTPGSACTFAFLESSFSSILRRALLSEGKEGPGHSLAQRGHCSR